MKMTPPSFRNSVWERQVLDWQINPNRQSNPDAKELDMIDSD